jgi:hypothetical protein
VDGVSLMVGCAALPTADEFVQLLASR